MKIRRTKRTTEISVETEELSLRHSERRVWLWCPSCRERVWMAAPDDAASLANVTPRTVYRWIEAERIHFAEQADSRLLVCVLSLSRRNGCAGAVFYFFRLPSQRDAN
jgi:hypothetical protein